MALPWLYAAGAGFGALGVWSWMGVRLLGDPVPGPPAAGAPAREHVSALRLLREDRLFARYLGWQFLLGVSNMMIEPAVVYAVSREMGAGYGASIAIVTVMPNVLMAPLPLADVKMYRLPAAS